MHHELTGPYNIPQGRKGHEESPTISTELSLISSSSQSKSKHVGASCRTRIYYSSASKSNGGRNYLKKTRRNNEKQYWSCSTSLELYDNPWKIKKALTASDLGKLNRLLFSAKLVENLMVPVLGGDAKKDVESGMGALIRVWDVDTMSMHVLILKRWATFKNYVLIGRWNRDFVKRRELKRGDEIGFHWDCYRHCFNFSVLKRAHQQ